MDPMDVDPLEGPSHLFASVLGDVTQEQWQDYRMQERLASGVVMDLASDEDEDSFLQDSRSSSPYFVDDELVTKFVVVHPEDDEAVVSEEETEIQDTWGSDAAMKYVNGEISFAELTDIMENTKPKSNSRKRKADGKLKAVETKQETRLQKEDKEFQEELKNKKKRTRRKTHNLPKHLEYLMGAANLSFAKGELNDAIKMCMEMIRQAPGAQEPYQTLGVLYEELGEMKKSLQCFLVGAYLNPSDTDEWIRLAEFSLEQSQIQQAIRCFSFAIRNEPNNTQILWERCNLYEQIGDKKNVLNDYELILRQLNSPEDGQRCVEVSREIAKVHHGNEDFVNAIKVLETAFSKFPSLITSEDVNLLLELQINQKYYKAAMKNFVQHCGVSLQIGDREILAFEELNSLEEKQFTEISRCYAPDVLPIDLQVKLLVCLIHLKALKAIQDLLTSLKQESPEEMGDLYLDVAEAFLDIEEYPYAESFLHSLVCSEKFNHAAVWLKYGDCLTGLSSMGEAVKAYQTVIDLAPSCQEARLALSKLLLDSGQKVEAAYALKQEHEDTLENTTLDFQALYKRCNLLYDLQHWNEFIKAATLAQYSHCYLIKTPEECSTVLSVQTYKRRHEILRDFPSIVNRPKPHFINCDITVEDMWDLYMKVSKKLFEFQLFDKLQTLALAGLTSNMFRKVPQMIKDADMLALLACYYNKNHRYAYIIVKDLVLKNLCNEKVWNMFCLIVTNSQEVRHNRFCLRLMMKHQDHLALGFLNGHNAMISGSYKHALGEYMCILKECPHDPFLLFCVGVTYIHMASQRFASRRNFLTLQGFAFLHKYSELQGESQESLYNLGRALHQLGLNDFALKYYKRALDTPPSVSIPGKNFYDLRREIAFNIALIYQNSESMNLVYMYLRKYIVV